MGMIASTGRNNDEMVDNLVSGWHLKSKRVELAFRLVDRGNFLHPAERTHSGYNDSAYRESHGDPIGHFHLSAPSIYAMALESLDVREGMSFLNIGSGTGYFSTIVGFLLGERGVSHGVEIYEHLVMFAEDRALEMSKSAAACAYGWCMPRYFHGNALQLRVKRGYDRIYCGALIPQSRRSFFCNMLNVNGVLVMPYETNLLRIHRKSETVFTISTVSNVTFGSLIPPNPENRLTYRPLVIGPRVPSTLEDICRCVVRAHIRQMVANEGGLPTIRSKTKPADDQSNGKTEQKPDNNCSRGMCPYAMIRRNMNVTSTRNMGRGGFHPPRPDRRKDLPAFHPSIIRRIANASGNRQEFEEFVHMIDNRYARHREAMGRNAALDHNGNAPAGANGRRVNLLELQREQERKKTDDRMLLDNDEFELIRGFRFERMVGSAIVEDVEDGFVDSDDEDHEMGEHQRRGAGQRRGSSSSDSSNDDHPNQQPRSTSRVTIALRAFAPSPPSPAPGVNAPSNSNGSASGGNSSNRDTENRNGDFGNRSEEGPLRPSRTEVIYPIRNMDYQNESLVIRFYDNSNVLNESNGARDTSNEDQLPRNEQIPSDNMTDDSSRPSSSTGGSTNVRIGGKRSGTFEEASTSKRVRSNPESSEAPSAQQSKENEMENESRDDTAKILEDGIGHALDAANEDDETSNNSERMDQNDEEPTASPSENGAAMDNTTSDEGVNKTTVSEVSGNSNAEPVASGAAEENTDKGNSTAVGQISSSENRVILSNSRDSNVSDSNVSEGSDASRETGDTTLARPRLFPIFYPNRPTPSSSNHSGLVSNQTSGDEGMNSARASDVPGTSQDSGSDTEMDDSDKERIAAIERQLASLSDFRQHFESRIEALPITMHMIHFLKYQ